MSPHLSVSCLPQCGKYGSFRHGSDPIKIFATWAKANGYVSLVTQ